MYCLWCCCFASNVGLPLLLFLMLLLLMVLPLMLLFLHLMLLFLPQMLLPFMLSLPLMLFPLMAASSIITLFNIVATSNVVAFLPLMLLLLPSIVVCVEVFLANGVVMYASFFIIFFLSWPTSGSTEDILWWRICLAYPTWCKLVSMCYKWV